MFYYYINNDFCKAQSINNNFDQFVINNFYKLVNNNKD